MMPHIKTHPPERLVVSGSDCIIIPLCFKPLMVTVKFVDPDPVVMPGCRPVGRDVVIASIVQLHDEKHNGRHHQRDHLWGIEIGWIVSGTREIEWVVTELTH